MITNCQKCGLSKTRVNVVVGRGSTSATVLFIGEAPGKSEDVLGRAFIGESGKLLDTLLKRSGIPPENCFYTNTVLCRPCNVLHGENREPSPMEVFLCLDNVLQTINCLNHLKGIVFAGKIAKKWYAARLHGLPQCYIMHPAALLRQGGAASPHYRDALNSLVEFRSVL
jgi:uracil-DNA glycosylase